MGCEVKKQPFVPDLSIFDRPKLCSVASFVQKELSPEDAATFEAALGSRYSTHVIRLWLAERGLTLGEQQVYRHRSGRCVCPQRPSTKDAA